VWVVFLRALVATEEGTVARAFGTKNLLYLFERKTSGREAGWLIGERQTQFSVKPAFNRGGFNRDFGDINLLQI
jgi:hypothetical protein